MIRCTNCGHENPDYCIFCRECGSTLSSINSVGSPSVKTEEQKEAENKPAPANTPVSYTPAPDPEPVQPSGMSANIPREIHTPDRGEYKYNGPYNNKPTNGKDAFAILVIGVAILIIFVIFIHIF